VCATKRVCATFWPIPADTVTPCTQGIALHHRLTTFAFFSRVFGFRDQRLYFPTPITFFWSIRFFKTQSRSAQRKAARPQHQVACSGRKRPPLTPPSLIFSFHCLPPFAALETRARSKPCSRTSWSGHWTESRCETSWQHWKAVLGAAKTSSVLQQDISQWACSVASDQKVGYTHRPIKRNVVPEPHSTLALVGRTRPVAKGGGVSPPVTISSIRTAYISQPQTSSQFRDLSRWRNRSHTWGHGSFWWRTFLLRMSSALKLDPEWISAVAQAHRLHSRIEIHRVRTAGRYSLAASRFPLILTRRSGRGQKVTR